MRTQINSGHAPNTYLRQFYRYLGARKDLLKNTSQSADTLAQLGGTHSIVDYVQFLRNARDVFQDPAIGLHLGKISELSAMHGTLGTATQNSLTLHDCLQIIQRYSSLRGTIIEVDWVDEQQYIGVEINFREDLAEMYPTVTEICISIIFSLIRMVKPDAISEVILELNYQAPDYLTQYQQSFPVSLVRFSRTATRILFPKYAVTSVSDTEPDQQLRASALERCEALLKNNVKKTSMSGAIAQLFSDNPGQLWVQPDIAKYLNTSVSTLQRLLRQENTSFKQLQNQWLMAKAKQQLMNPTLTVECIALLLGYSDVSNFRQACHRWYGMSPNMLRKKLLAQDNCFIDQ